MSSIQQQPLVDDEKDDDDEAWRNDDFLSLETKVKSPPDGDDDDTDEDDLFQPSDDDADFADDTNTTNLQQQPWDPKTPPPWLEQGLFQSNSNNDNSNGGGRNSNMKWNKNGTTPLLLHPLTALHNEIVAFVQLLEPLPSEIRQREQLIERVRRTVRDTFETEEDALLEIFGSQATGLFLPSSDIDLVVMTKESKEEEQSTAATLDNTATSNGTTSKGGDNKEDDDTAAALLPTQKSPLQRFAQAMQQPQWVQDLSYLEAIESTRIPLVKFTVHNNNGGGGGSTTTNDGGTSVDVSFNQPTGPPAARFMKQYLHDMPPLRPLTIVLKYFLAARSLNEPYTGGVGSFMLQLMIVAFLQQRERDARNYHRPSAYNLGTLLLEFFHLYGLELNYYTTGISVRYDGSYFPKGAQDRHPIFVSNKGGGDRMGMLALENPLDPTLDVGQSSFRYPTVQRAFAVAYRVLLSYMTSEPRELRHMTSILAAILPPTHYMTHRLLLKRRDRPLSSQRQNNTNNNTQSPSTTSNPSTSSDGRRHHHHDRKRQRRR